MHVQKWDVQLPDLDDGSGSWRQRSAEYVLQCQRWQDQLLLSAPSMTALSLGPNVLHPPVLGRLPLRHLELQVKAKQPWLAGVLKDLRHITTLESLTIVSRAPLPEVQLESLKSLRHVKLHSALPTKMLSLPEGCLLHLHAYCCRRVEWEAHSQGIEKHTFVLHLNAQQLKALPSVGLLPNLQCLTIELPFGFWAAFSCTPIAPLDLATLQHVPHVRLISFRGSMKLKVTSGSWQTLDIRGLGCPTLTEIDALLKSAKMFTFDFCDGVSEIQAKLAAVCRPCHKSWGHHEYYKDRGYAIISTAEDMVQDYASHADRSCQCSSDTSACELDRNKCLWDEDTMWPRDPCAKSC